MTVKRRLCSSVGDEKEKDEELLKGMEEPRKVVRL